jgi:hypothetical protein
VSKPEDLDGLENPYVGFSEDREILRQAFDKLGYPLAEFWIESITSMRSSPQFSDASDNELIEKTMYVLLDLIKDHPLLHG